jgi:DNA topoisomerase II
MISIELFTHSHTHSLALVHALLTPCTVIGMAQDFMGSNNINLLVPSGQFGTRLTGGKDAASPRYIFTYLHPITRAVFPEADDALLNYLEDDGQMIEPEYFCPVIPLLVVNGCQGIGTGWSTFIPPHNPLDVVNYLRSKLDGDDSPPQLQAYSRGFTGQILEREDGNGYRTIGCIDKQKDGTLKISELPPSVWTSDYKSVLIKMREQGLIKSFVENHTTTKVSFSVSIGASTLRRLERSELTKAFRLESSLPTTNMHAMGIDGAINKYTCAEEIIDDFFPTRLDMYDTRRSVMESEIRYVCAVMENKAKFIQSITRGEIDLMKGSMTKHDIVSRFHTLGLSRYSDLQKVREDNTLAKRKKATMTLSDDSELGASSDADLSSDYDYLLSMPLSTLTSTKIEELSRDVDKKKDELSRIQGLSSSDMWRADLDRLANML